jgi:hypothetical protein
MKQENFNDAVYRDEEITIEQKMELLDVCRFDYSHKIWEIYSDLSLIEKTEMLHLITSAQLVILNKYTKEKNQ